MPINSFDDYPMNWKPKLSHSSTYPMYIELTNQLKADIASGKLTPGTKLPPQRELADFLDINLSTVTRAYKLCEQSGLISSAVGKGTFIASDVGAAGLMLLNDSDKKLIEMGPILPNPDINELVSDYLCKMTIEPDFYKLLQYGKVDYDELQIKACMKWLGYFGIEAGKENILFSNGSQNGIFASMAALFKEGDRVATMPVSYPGIKSIAKILGIQLIPLPLADGEAVTQKALDYVVKNQKVKGFYFIPDFNNPSAELLTVKEREMIGAFSKEHDIIIIEDAIYTLFSPHPISPIASFAPDNTVFISSVSKTLSPGLRLAVVSSPKRFHEMIMGSLYAMQITPPSMMTQLFTRLILSGRFERIRRLRIDELEKRNRLFEEICKDADSRGDLNCPIRWIHLPKDKYNSPREFEIEAEQNGIQVYGGERFTVGTSTVPLAIRISLISAHPISEYKKALKTLNKLL